jgi:hypothetical protein
MPSQVLYSADLTAGSLKLRESRVIADLLLAQTSEEQFREAIVRKNVLQCRTQATAIRLARLIKGRLEGFDSGLWLMVRDGEKLLATQALLAAAVKQSALLRDFMDLVLRDEYRLLHTHLAPGIWPSFLEGCMARDPVVGTWSDSTRRRLRSTVFQVLAQAGFLGDTSKRELQNVTILPELATYLTNRHDQKLLCCLQLP